MLLSCLFLAEPELSSHKNGFTEKISVEVGSDVTLICPFKNFNHFLWYKNAEIFHDDNSKATNIVFHNISTADQG